MTSEIDIVDLQQDLIPERTRPIPLPSDFYKIIVDRNPPRGTKPDDLFKLSSPRLHETSIIQAAEEIIGRNETAIDEASRRIAASSLPVYNGPIYHNLIPTTFDEKKLIANAEANLEKQRQAAARSVKP